MIELYSRGIKLNDLRFITDELKEGARAGHYYYFVLNQKNRKHV